VDVDWADLALRLVAAGPEDRAALEFKACHQALQNKPRLVPGQWVPPDPWSEGDSRQVHSLRALTDTFRSGGKLVFNYDAFRVSAEACGAAFTRWRNAVHDFEADEASKLTTVMWTYRTLFRLRDELDVAMVDRMASVVADALEREWACTVVPLEGDYREWAVRSTRRYDLLPRQWRYV
jgi:hypothetical protein